MKNTFFYFLLLLQSSLFCQYVKIDLPKDNGSKIKYYKNGITSFFSIYVTKKKEIYLEDIEVSLESLPDSIIKNRDKIKETLLPFMQIHLLADKNLKYRFIQKIKSQITKTNNLILAYRTGNINDIESGLLNRINIQIIKKRNRKKEKALENFYKEIKVVKDPIYKIIDLLYYLDFDEAKKLMKDYKYLHIHLKNKNEIKLNGKTSKIDDIEKINKYLFKADFILLTTNEKMSYESYLKNLSILTNNHRKNRITSGFIEISQKLNKYMRKNQVKFFNINF